MCSIMIIYFDDQQWTVWNVFYWFLQVGLGQLYFQGGRGIEVNHEVSTNLI